MNNYFSNHLIEENREIDQLINDFGRIVSNNFREIASWELDEEFVKKTLLKILRILNCL